jgi:hypothetical protein
MANSNLRRFGNFWEIMSYRPCDKFVARCSISSIRYLSWLKYLSSNARKRERLHVFHSCDINVPPHYLGQDHKACMPLDHCHYTRINFVPILGHIIDDCNTVRGRCSNGQYLERVISVSSENSSTIRSSRLHIQLQVSSPRTAKRTFKVLN